MTMPGPPAPETGLSDHAGRNRAAWNADADDYQARGSQLVARGGMGWGAWHIPESELRVLGDVAGRDILELGCGAAQWSIALGRAGPAGPADQLGDQPGLADAGLARHHHDRGLTGPRPLERPLSRAISASRPTSTGLETRRTTPTIIADPIARLTWSPAWPAGTERVR
jgi:hypothetical protein